MSILASDVSKFKWQELYKMTVWHPMYTFLFKYWRMWIFYILWWLLCSTTLWPWVCSAYCVELVCSWDFTEHAVPQESWSASWFVTTPFFWTAEQGHSRCLVVSILVSSIWFLLNVTHVEEAGLPDYTESKTHTQLQQNPEWWAIRRWVMWWPYRQDSRCLYGCHTCKMTRTPEQNSRGCWTWTPNTCVMLSDNGTTNHHANALWPQNEKTFKYH